MGLRFIMAVFLYPFGALLGATNSFDAVQLSYNLKTTVEAYEKVGAKSPRWDADAKQCLKAFAQLRSASKIDESRQELQRILPKLAAAKCDDPMIRYLHLRFVFSQNHSQQENAVAYAEVANALQKSAYPDIRKFYATYWSAAVLKTGSVATPATAKLLEQAAGYLTKALDDRSMPTREATESCDLIMSFPWWTQPVRWSCYQILEPALTNRWKGTALQHLTKGCAYLSYAWVARGTGYANTVNDESWKVMGARLKTAAEELEQAWQLDPKNPQICLEMMRVELGRGDEQNRLDTWFERGMKLDPASYDLCYAKLEYLRPRWYGSIEEMIDFGRACTGNTNFAGPARLMLADAHLEASREIHDDEKRAVYWKQPNVWQDIQKAFIQFFWLYPQEVGYRHNYARYAVLCDQWQEFKDQVKLFPSTNYAYFGGIDKFKATVEHADEEIKKKSP